MREREERRGRRDWGDGKMGPKRAVMQDGHNEKKHPVNEDANRGIKEFVPALVSLFPPVSVDRKSVV